MPEKRRWGCCIIVDYDVAVANKLALNTTDHPGLTQYLQNTSTGLFDFKAQQAAGVVDVSAKPTTLKIKLLAKVSPVNGKPWLKEV